ncbi:DarT ssDNA thymidine ADP-ribosyltransferase family protein [Iodidimonas gelatinilytica]|uniref:DarT ssDNA thymidine ADP-ribosyltransferase family protein n=1 Tax=Iodidimonas gelatinilytica TaxID=1236966 RepID=UPI001B300129|nr:DarT ssDNA thymidine ADP-ribosyltransferase family protein [Iodidimonas gelatinilytica]
MPNRFIFRQVCAEDLKTFLDDGEIRAKNHPNPQRCHQVSYAEIVNRRGENGFAMPCGRVVNDYVPFYFSPLTSFTFTIHSGNVSLKSPDGEHLRMACDDDRIFFVCSVDAFREAEAEICFSNLALNSQSGDPKITTDLDKIESHINWAVFDDSPKRAQISEIGYEGVCQYFQNRASPVAHQNRSAQRMAEFLVKDAISLEHISCIVAKTNHIGDNLQSVMDASNWDIPIFVKPGCYF